MKIRIYTTVVVVSITLVALMVLASCGNKNAQDKQSAVVETVIAAYDEFGSIDTDVTREQMQQAGFDLGDEVEVSTKDTTLVVPLYDGYYVKSGENQVVAYPTYKHVRVAANFGSLPDILLNKQGEKITFKLVTKGKYLEVQKAMGLAYTNNRKDYDSDEEFTNFRMVTVGKIAPSRLFRAASPFDNSASRATYVSALIEKAGVQTIFDLADDENKMKSYSALPHFSKKMWDDGNVVLCPLTANFLSDDFNQKLVSGLKELAKHPAPYFVHCTEGKDRTGYVCAMLGALCGASYDEVLHDYLLSYCNYYHLSLDKKKDMEVCQKFVELRFEPCVMNYCNINDASQLASVDLKKAYTEYLLAHGMTQAEIDAIVTTLTK